MTWGSPRPESFHKGRGGVYLTEGVESPKPEGGVPQTGRWVTPDKGLHKLRGQPLTGRSPIWGVP